MPFIVALALIAQTGAVADIDRAISEGIRIGAFPGAVVVVGTGDTVLISKGYGHFTWSSESPVPSADSTLYDLASLTKVVATTPAIMRLVDAGRLDIDTPVRVFLPEFAGDGKAAVTVRNLLEHRSGLRAFLPLNERAATEKEARHLVLSEPLRWKPASRVVYSDLNAMLLGWIVERVSGVPLDRFAQAQLFQRLGMTQTMFRPSVRLRQRIAPVGLWRGHVIAGELHDQNAVRLGGVSGHAGLYSTGTDLARYAQLYLKAGHDREGLEHFSPAIVQRFVERGPGNRALGWEVRDTADDANTGRLLSASAFGHGGYTGTSIWIDPAGDLFVIVLTNRVFAPRTSRSITTLKAVRARVADAAVALRSEACDSVVIGARMRQRC